VEAVDEISLLVNETVSQTEMIALASREQRVATEQIISTIQGVDDAVNENIQHYQTSTKEVTRLNAEVRVLNTLVTDLSGTGKVA
jgi:methyl-accepting chemotaxis protein